MNWVIGTILSFFVAAAWGDGLTEAEVDNICAAAKKIPIPKKDLPSSSFKENLSSEEYYDPALGKPDYQKARWSAYQEWKTEENGVLDGSYILAILYANGQGVAKNIPLAIRFMCDTQSVGRDFALQKMENKDLRKINLVLDLSWGVMSGDDALSLSSHVDYNRQKRLEASWKKMAEKFSPEQKMAFSSLTKAAKHWIDERTPWELDNGAGGLWNKVGWLDEAIPEEWNRFNTLLKDVLSDRVPRANADVGKLEKELDQTILQASLLLRAGLIYPSHNIHLDPSQLKELQEYWQKYRTAWRRFYVSLYPNRSGQAIDTYLLQERIDDWREFVGSIGPGPSFSCRKASEKSEKAICESNELSALDRKMSADYQQRIHNEQDHQRLEELKQQQRQWLKKLHSCGADRACLLNRYKERIGPRF